MRVSYKYLHFDCNTTPEIEVYCNTTSGMNVMRCKNWPNDFRWEEDKVYIENYKYLRFEWNIVTPNQYRNPL